VFVQTVNENASVSDFAVGKIKEVVDKFIPDPIGVRVKFATCRHLQKVTAIVNGGSAYSVVASETSSNVYDAIDKVVGKVERQLHRKKDKLLKRKRISRHLQLVENCYEDTEQSDDWIDQEIEEEGAWIHQMQ
jgi:ribosomal subunit interface protein